MKNIVIVGDPARNMIHAIADGVKRFSREVEPYGFMVEAHLPQAFDFMDSGVADAMLGMIFDSEPQKRVIEAGYKVVNVSQYFKTSMLPSVQTDSVAIGEMAAEYFLRYGYRHFFYYGERTYFADLRGEGFAGKLAAHGYECQIWKTDWGEEEFEEIEAYLRGVEGRVAVLCSGDNHAARFIGRLKHRGLIPLEDYAILGVNNDTGYSNFCATEISSIDPNFELMGYRAAEKLHAQFIGEPYEMLTLIKPLGVVTKLTTESAIEDPLLLQALDFIQQHALTGLTTDMLIDHLNCSRRSIETRFRDQMKISITKYIVQVQMTEAGHRLRMTSDSVGQVAFAVGYKDQRYFARVFKNYHGVTPTQYRESIL